MNLSKSALEAWHGQFGNIGLLCFYNDESECLVRVPHLRVHVIDVLMFCHYAWHAH